MNKKLLTIFLVTMSCCMSIFAQDRKVSGKVTSAEDGSGLPGVSVQIKGSTKGVQTDGSGFYSITVPSSNSALDFSFVGVLITEGTSSAALS